MPYTPRTADEILRDMRNDIRAASNDTDPWIWPNNLVPLLKAFAQAHRAAYLRLDFIHQQAFISTARAEYLDYHGIDNGGLSRDPASYAQGYANATTSPGTVVNDGTLFTRGDGLQFVVIGTVTAVTTTLPVFLRAVTPGEASNTDVGASLYPLVPVSGVDFLVVDSGGLIGGAEEETDDSFRQRILFYTQNPPAGGKPAEYVAWAQTKTGVTRVFVKRATPQAGSVTIYFMMDGIGDGIPSVDNVSEMQGLLEQFAPADAEVIVAAPTAEPINVTVNGLYPDTPAIRTAVIDELKAMFLRKAEPASASEDFIFSKSWLEEASAMAPRRIRSRITAPADDVTISTPGNIPVLGTVTFT